jgi:uncharacterized protein (UPF0262 family)
VREAIEMDGQSVLFTVIESECIALAREHGYPIDVALSLLLERLKRRVIQADNDNVLEFNIQRYAQRMIAEDRRNR